MAIEAIDPKRSDRNNDTHLSSDAEKKGRFPRRRSFRSLAGIALGSLLATGAGIVALASGGNDTLKPATSTPVDVDNNGRDPVVGIDNKPAPSDVLPSSSSSIPVTPEQGTEVEPGTYNREALERLPISQYELAPREHKLAYFSYLTANRHAKFEEITRQDDAQRILDIHRWARNLAFNDYKIEDPQTGENLVDTIKALRHLGGVYYYAGGTDNPSADYLEDSSFVESLIEPVIAAEEFTVNDSRPGKLGKDDQGNPIYYKDIAYSRTGVGLRTSRFVYETYTDHNGEDASMWMLYRSGPGNTLPPLATS